MSRVAGIIQARLGSTRLPNKMLLHLNGFAVVQWVVLRAAKSAGLDHLVVAVPEGRSDDPLAEFLLGLDVEVFRGAEQDVLDRFYRAARAVRADHVVRICADNPLIGWEAIDLLIDRHLAAGADYTYNHIPRKNLWPDGLGAEICTMDTLAAVHEKASQPGHREHSFNYLWENTGRFRIYTFDPPRIAWQRPELKLDIDTWQDFLYLQRLGFHPDMDIDTILETLDKASR